LDPGIRKAIAESPLDDGLSNQITDAYHKLTVSSSRLVAVRSSAVSEGTVPMGSGAPNSMLNISSEQDLIGAIKTIWVNHYVDEATIRKELGAREQSAGVAVIVQTMVRAAKSGVMFTANPSTMDRSTVLIEATGREGHTFVSGDSTNDQYFVSKVTLEIERKVLPQGQETPKPCLAQTEINHLVEVGKSVEKYLHRPQEIYWIAEATNKAGESGLQFFFVKSKPLPVPERTKPAAGSNVFSFVTSAVNRRVKVG
jgi:pyruvate,water dikinase